jgi:hypothetical protein
MVGRVSEELRQDNVEMLLVKDTVQAAEHAALKGLIFHEAIPAVEQEKRKDETAADGPDDETSTGEPVMK